MSQNLSKCHIVGNHMARLIYNLGLTMHMPDYHINFKHAAMVNKYVRKISRILYTGSCMNTCVLQNLLNTLRKSDKMRGLSSILSVFATGFINSILLKHEG